MRTHARVCAKSGGGRRRNGRTAELCEYIRTCEELEGWRIRGRERRRSLYMCVRVRIGTRVWDTARESEKERECNSDMWTYGAGCVSLLAHIVNPILTRKSVSSERRNIYRVYSALAGQSDWRG